MVYRETRQQNIAHEIHQGPALKFVHRINLVRVSLVEL